jgi:hypothetical protein
MVLLNSKCRYHLHGLVFTSLNVFLMTIMVGFRYEYGLVFRSSIVQKASGKTELFKLEKVHSFERIHMIHEQVGIVKNMSLSRTLYIFRQANR